MNGTEKYTQIASDIMIYISSACLRYGKDIIGVLKRYEELGIKNVELSSSHVYAENLLEQLKTFKFNYIIHNYFPPSKEPFILNLASQNKAVLSKTVQNIKASLNFCKGLKSDIYGVHPGYRQDPNKKFEFDKNQPITDYKAAFDTFIKSVRELVDYASKLGIVFGIENNVSGTTESGDVTGYSFMCKEDEFRNLFKEINSPKLGVVLDFGHLKVNSYRLCVDRDKFIDSIRDKAIEVHLSDNNGEIDEHNCINDRSWFFYSLKQFRNVPITLESRNQSEEEIMENYDLIKHFLK